jgi:predicted AlkP superfamily phosphohydrolase/phosphomutase
VACGLLAVCVVLAVLACSRPRTGRALLIGIDGASPRVVTPLIEAGRLPNLTAIAVAGVYAPLRSHPPITSPRIWTSIATGLLPDRHGILGFGYVDERGVRRLFTSSQRKVPAIWNILSAAGRRVAVVNWWNTYPVEKVDGVIVSDHLLVSDIRGRKNITGAKEETLGTIAWPLEWDTRAKARLEDDTPLTGVPDPFADRESLPGWSKPERLSQRYQNDADVVRIALDAEAEVDPDLMLVFLPGIDRVSHVLWATLEPPEAYKHPMPMNAQTRAAGAEALRNYYVYTDALIGRLLERYDPERDLVMVVSDHGFEAGQKLGYLTGTHDGIEAIDGVFFARGPGIARPNGPHRRFSVNDITPTLLAWLGLPPAQDMDGRPLPILETPVPTYVASYADTPVERLAVVPSGAEPDIIEQLDALGYLERDGEGDARP